MSQPSQSSSDTLMGETKSLDLVEVNARLESYVFDCGFLDSPIHVVEAFARNALILCLNLVEDLDSPFAQDLRRRDLEQWRGIIQRRASRVGHDPYTLSLLWELFSVSGGSITNRRRMLDPNLTDLTPSDHLALYGRMLSVHVAAPPRFPRWGPSALQNALRVSALGQHIQPATDFQISESIGMLASHLPITFAELTISDLLLEKLGIRDQKHFEIFRAQTDVLTPALEGPLFDLYLLLIWSPASTGRIIEAFYIWANSEDGQSTHNILKTELSNPNDPVKAALIVGALTSLERLKYRGCSGGQQSAPKAFHQFLHFLNGYHSISPAALGSISHSYCAVVVNLLDPSVAGIVRHLLSNILACDDLVSEPTCIQACVYWEYRILRSCGHVDTLQATDKPSTTYKRSKERNLKP